MNCKPDEVQATCFDKPGLAILLSGIVCLATVGLAGAEQARMPLLMPDDFGELCAVSWRVELGVLDKNNPLIEGDMPWDAGGVMSHGTVLRDPIDGLWKAWLVCTPPEEMMESSLASLPSALVEWLATVAPEETKGVSSFNHFHRRVCYFQSTDGVHWTRPKLSNSSFGDHDQTNIVFGGPDGIAQYASVIVDPANREWPYEMFVLFPNMSRALGGEAPSGLCRYRSRDGKQWQRVGGPIKGPFTSDVCYVYRGENGGYVGYFRLVRHEDKSGHVPPYEGNPARTNYRVFSPDGEHWTDTEIIMKRDERDHRDTQYMECVPHKVKGGYLGMVTMYHPITQTLDLRLAASRDGRKWWFPDRRPCLANPPLGDYGGGMIWQCKDLIVQDNTLYVYYSGSEGIHRAIWDTRARGLKQVGLESVITEGSGILPFNGALCRAGWRFDRMYALASSVGGPTIGTAVTKPQELKGKQLRVNLVTRPPKKSTEPEFDEGYMQVELLDSQGEPMAGFTREDCALLRGDHQALQVKWTGGDRCPDEAKKARFYLKRAFLYGFEFSLP